MIEPQPPERVMDTPLKDLQAVDQSEKILTGRTPERTMSDSGCSFYELYGLNRAMKLFVELNNIDLTKKLWVLSGTEPDYGHYNPQVKGHSNVVSLDGLFLEATRLRKALRDNADEAQSTTDIEVQLIMQLIAKYSPTIEVEPNRIKGLLSQHSDDNVLNIGDPWRVTNKHIDEPRVKTIDYESGERATAGDTRVPNGINRDIRSRLTDFNYTGTAGAMKDLEYAWSDIKPGENWDRDWLFGTKERAGFRVFMKRASHWSDKMVEQPTVENIAGARRCWERVEQEIDKRRNHYFQTENRDINIPNYDDSDGLHPMDVLTKNMKMLSRQCKQQLTYLEYYRTDIFPKFILEHIETFADLHVMSYSGERSVNKDDFELYRYMWDDHLESYGIDPATFDPHADATEFINLLILFYSKKGSRTLSYLDPDLSSVLEEKITDGIMEKFPVEVAEKEATLDQMMFPQTQELPGGAYDRIVASWSFSAHMMPKMTANDLINGVWPEIDRLLTRNGRATIFPIGHYGEEPKWIEQTIHDYLRISGSRWTVDLSKDTAQEGKYEGDETFMKDKLLVIIKH
jgi:hypothetical protein